MKWLKNGEGKSFIFHEIIPVLFPFLVKILFVLLTYLYIQYALISIMKTQNSNQNVKVCQNF